MTIYDLKQQTNGLILTLNEHKCYNRDNKIAQLKKFLAKLDTYSELECPKAWLLYAMWLWADHIKKITKW